VFFGGSTRCFGVVINTSSSLGIYFRWTKSYILPSCRKARRWHGENVHWPKITLVIKLTLSTDSSKGQLSFAFVIISCTWRSFVFTILPRAANIAFTYSQSFLIHSTVSYLGQEVQLRDRNYAYGLIGGTGLVYVGMAVSALLQLELKYSLLSIYQNLSTHARSCECKQLVGVLFARFSTTNDCRPRRTETKLTQSH
jgi:hypothetical protein